MLGDGEGAAGLRRGFGGLAGGGRQGLGFGRSGGGGRLRPADGVLGRLDGLLQRIGLGRGFDEAQTERRGVFFAIRVHRGGGGGHDRVTFLAEPHDGFLMLFDDLALDFDLTGHLGLLEPQGRQGLIRGGELRLERVEFRPQFRQSLLGLRDDLPGGFDPRGGGDLGGLVLGLGGGEVGEVLLELGELVLPGQDADVELGGLEEDEAFALRGGLGGEIADVDLGGGEADAGLGEGGVGRTVGLPGRPDQGGLLGETLGGFVLGGDGLVGLLPLFDGLGLALHRLPIGEALLLLGELGFELRELLGGGLAFGLMLGQRGFGDRQGGLRGLQGGLGRRERGHELGETLLGGDEAVGQLRRIAGDLRDLAAGLAFEETDFAEPIGGDEGLGIVEGDDLGDLVGLPDALRLRESLAIDPPEGRGAVRAGREEASVRQEGDRADVAAVGRPAGDLLAGLHLPGHDHAVGGTAGQDVGVGPPGEVGDDALVLAEVVEFAAVVGLPDEDVAVAVGGREQDAVRAEVRAGDPFGVLGDDVELLAGGDVEALHLLGIGAEGDLAVVRGDVGRHYLVELLADLGDPPSRPDVPDHGVPGLAPAAAAQDEERPVGAELERARMALGVRKDTRELMGVGVVEQDLLLAGDRQQGGPRTGRHRDHRAGTGRHDDRLQQDVLRAGHGTGRPAGATGEGKVDLGPGGGLRHAPLRLEQAAGDPFG